MIAFDTNVLVYSFEVGEKAEVARRLVETGTSSGALLPLQVIGEFVNACRRKVTVPYEKLPTVTERLLHGFRVVSTKPYHVVDALVRAERFGLQYFDALIVTVARDAGATILLSEDMQDGIDLDGLVVLNPFSPTNAHKIEAAWPRA